MGKIALSMTFKEWLESSVKEEKICLKKHLGRDLNILFKHMLQDGFMPPLPSEFYYEISCDFWEDDYYLIIEKLEFGFLDVVAYYTIRKSDSEWNVNKNVSTKDYGILNEIGNLIGCLVSQMKEYYNEIQ